jgi:hypothetical protein
MVIWLSNCTGKEEEFVLSSNSVTVAQSFPVAAVPSQQINNNDNLKRSRNSRSDVTPESPATNAIYAADVAVLVRIAQRLL